MLSHAHFDHMGSIADFPKARLLIQKQRISVLDGGVYAAAQFASSPVVHPDDLRTAFDASLEHRLTLLEGDADNVLPGIHVRFGPGHTIGQQFIIVETAKGRIVVSGDCIYGARNILGANNDGVYIPLGAGVGCVWDQVKTIDRMNSEIGGDMSRLIILHDFDRWKTLDIVREIDGFRVLRAA